MTRFLSCASLVPIVFAATVTMPTVAATADGAAALKLRIQTTGTPAQTLSLDLQRWSTEQERAPIVSALSAQPAADGTGRGAGGRGAGAPGRGAGGRGPAAAPPSGGGPTPAGRQGVVDDVPADSNDAPAPTAAATGVAGRGGAGRGAAGARGGGGRGRGAATNVSPVARLAAAVKAAPTLGYIWGGGVTGYSVRYAWRSSTNGRTERLILITDRRLDVPTAPAAPAASSTASTVPSGVPGDAAADFTIIEIRFDPKGTGEGKTSLTTSAVIDQAAGTIALQNYDAIPPQLRITP